MSLYYNLLHEQINLLKEKGYEEKSISSPNKEGWLFAQLRRNYSDALQQSWLEGDPVTFQIATSGFFNNDKDIVHFKFSYEFNPGNSSLIIKEMELNSDKVQRKISVQSPNDIPHSSQALALIGEQIQLQRKRMNHNIHMHASQQQRKIR